MLIDELCKFQEAFGTLCSGKGSPRALERLFGMLDCEVDILWTCNRDRIHHSCSILRVVKRVRFAGLRRNVLAVEIDFRLRPWVHVDAFVGHDRQLEYVGKERR